MTRWLAYRPTDALGQLGASFHAYSFNTYCAETARTSASAGHRTAAICCTVVSPASYGLLGQSGLSGIEFGPAAADAAAGPGGSQAVAGVGDSLLKKTLSQLPRVLVCDEEQRVLQECFEFWRQVRG